MKIILEREKCIGCGSCEAMCPKYWKMADDSKVNLLGSKDVGTNNYELETSEAGCNQEAADICELETEKIECNQEAADVCPVQCIQIDKP